MDEAYSRGFKVRDKFPGEFHEKNLQIRQTNKAMRVRFDLVRGIHKDSEVLECSAANLHQIQNWAADGM